MLEGAYVNMPVSCLLAHGSKIHVTMQLVHLYSTVMLRKSW